MIKIHIEWLYDECDCETCGVSVAEGCLVTGEDGKVIYEFKPKANCFGDCSQSKEDALMVILYYLGYEVTESCLST